MTHIRFTTYSDDCANCTVDGRTVGEVDEAWGVWAPFTVDGHRVGDVRVDYDNGWVFHLRSLPGHTFTVDLPAGQPTEEAGDDRWRNTMAAAVAATPVVDEPSEAQTAAFDARENLAEQHERQDRFDDRAGRRHHPHR